MSKALAGSTGLETPENAAFSVRFGSAPPHQSMTSASGVPSSTSWTPGTHTSPTTVTTTVPADSGVPIERYHVAPRARMWAAAANVSTLLTSVGLLAWLARAGVPASQPIVTVANRPCCHGGSRRGSGSRPSITSSNAFSSPNRYSSGPSTIEIVSSPSRPASPSSTAARRRLAPSTAKERLTPT